MDGATAVDGDGGSPFAKRMRLGEPAEPDFYQAELAFVDRRTRQKPPKTT